MQAPRDHYQQRDAGKADHENKPVGQSFAFHLVIPDSDIITTIRGLARFLVETGGGCAYSGDAECVVMMVAVW